MTIKKEVVKKTPSAKATEKLHKDDKIVKKTHAHKEDSAENTVTEGEDNGTHNAKTEKAVEKKAHKEVKHKAKDNKVSAKSKKDKKGSDKKISIKKVTKSKFNCKDTVYATGKRKESVAKIWIKEGTGQFIINGKTLEGFIHRRLISEVAIKKPFVVTSLLGKFDVRADVVGGGVSAQAEAIMYGEAKALLKFYETKNVEKHEASKNIFKESQLLESEEKSTRSPFKSILKKSRLLTSDKRKVEPKKYGHRKARRSEQFSKR